MKPLRLTVQAFGPYVGREVIDFTRLSGGGLFLIHGHTGAGKTSVLDGLCFALFGKSSGADRVGEGMRCHLSTPDTGTEVCLEFSLGEDLYRILRRPKQELNKKRGTGTTVSEPFGELYRGRAARVATDAFDLDRIEWTPVATGTQKTLDAVTALLGMNDEQFCQIVILPQGQFRKFLAAGSTEREKILEILFQTNRFRAATETLVFAAKKIEDQYQEKRLLLSGQMQALEVSDFSALQTTLDQLKNQRDGLAKEGSDLSAEHKLKSDRLTAARDWNNYDSEVAKNAAAFTEIERQQPMIAGQVEKLRLHDRSAPVLAAELHLHGLVTEKHAIDERGLVEVTQQMDLARELVQWQARAEQQAQQLPKVQSQRSEMDRLAERQHQAEKLISTKKLLDQYRTDLQNSVRACQSSESEIAALNASHESKTKEQQTHATCAGERAHFLTIRSLLEQERQSLHEAMKLSADLKRFLQAQSTLADEARILTGQVESLKVEFRKMKRDFHLSMAAQLAAELQEEMPCKVCGSLSHPSPASMPEGAPTQVALEMSEMNLQKEESRLVALQKRLVKAESEIGSRRDELSRRLGQEHITDGTIENLLSAKQRLINENEAAIAKTEKASISAARLAEEIKNFEKNLQLRREAAAAQLRKREEITLKLEATAAAINEIEAMLPPEYRDLLALTARGLELRHFVEEFERESSAIQNRLQELQHAQTASKSRLDSLKEQARSKDEECKLATSKLAQTLSESGFASMDDCRSVLLTDDLVNEFQMWERQFAQNLAVAASRRDELEMKKTELLQNWPAGATELTLTQCELEVSQAEHVLAQFQARQGSVVSQLAALELAEKRLLHLNQELRSLEEQFAVLGKVAGVAAGKPPHNLTGVNFSRYILGAQLDEVLAHASQRLSIMSRGQFTLHRVRGRDDRRMSAGLDLEVQDSFTGTARPAAYLSGGESFVASLALALGLADVVQSYLGGIRLDAIFVDEGFGSLDGDALELALRTLSELKGGGRMVGIISHVPELKDQISNRLHIRKSPSGSLISWDS